MFKTYFKQTMQMLKQNKFISTISIIGTAIAIMMVMVIIVTDEIKTSDITPEINRSRTLYLKHQNLISVNGQNTNSSPISYVAYKNLLSDLETPELTTAIQFDFANFDNCMIRNVYEKGLVSGYLKQVDANFWRIMPFSFIDGKPFTQDDFVAGLKKAVISDKLEKKIFGNESAIGKDIIIDTKPYTVTGVVKNISRTFQYAFADIWIPYTSRPEFENRYYSLLLLAKNKKDFDLIDKEVRAREKRLEEMGDDYRVSFHGPYDQKIQLLNTWSDSPPNIKEARRKNIIIFSILLLIPAVNLSSISFSKLSKRVEEIGIRKTFGAKRINILTQVLLENFTTSIIGGFIGLIFSYVIIFWMKEWLLNVSADSTIPLQALVSFPVIISVVIICMFINLLSTGIPAYLVSKSNIVKSINEKQ
ncbi:ABC transporter permease [Bacteroidales bacterium OttesenSCG-928-C19]|nr:ABC transporter permease [Bacteroidales bacterium OttesenSCG-928-C19]